MLSVLRHHSKNVSAVSKFRGALFGVLLAFLPLAAQADSYESKVKGSDFYASILEAAKTKKGREMLDFLDQQVQDDARRVHAASLWLRDNSIDQKDPQKINALYFLSYSDMLGTIAQSYRDAGQPAQYRALLKPMVLNFYIFELMGSVDAARCQDPTALDAVTRGMAIPRANDLGKEVFAILTREDFDTIEHTALEEEQKMQSRPPNLDICALGEARLRDLAAAPGVKQQTVTDLRYKSGKRVTLVPPPGYSYVPSVMPDSEWQDARRKVLSDVTTRWAKRYEGFTRP